MEFEEISEMNKLERYKFIIWQVFKYIYCGAGESKDTYPHIYRARGPNQERGQTRGVIEAHSCRRRRQC